MVNLQNGYREQLMQLLLWENIRVNFLLAGKMIIRLFLSKMKPYGCWDINISPALFASECTVISTSVPKINSGCDSDFETFMEFHSPTSSELPHFNGRRYNEVPH